MEINLPKFEGISLNIPLNYNFNSRILVFTSSNLTNLRISRDTFIYSSYIDGSFELRMKKSIRLSLDNSGNFLTDKINKYIQQPSRNGRVN